MTRILYVHGEDYAAVTFERLVERGVVTARDLWWDASSRVDASAVYDPDGDDRFEYRALEFGIVDPTFARWVLDQQDYDAAKSATFYVLDDE